MNFLIPEFNKNAGGLTGSESMGKHSFAGSAKTA